MQIKPLFFSGNYLTMNNQFLSAIMLLLTLTSNVSNAAEFKSEKIASGFRAMYQQSDPFDTASKKYISFSKDDFVFNCKQISFGETGTYYHDSFSFPATVALKIDSNAAIQERGTYSTYQFGSDLINDDRMYSMRLTPEVIQQLKDGSTLQASGKFSSGGWTAFKLNLQGFTKAFNKVCQ